MSKFFLLNNIRVGSSKLFAGTLIDDATRDVSKIRSAGGVLITSANGPAAAAAALAQKFRKKGAPEVYLAELMQSALDFQHERFPKGANLGNADATIFWSDGLRRVHPAATLSAGRSFTVSPLAGADGRLPKAGDRLFFSRLDVGAFTTAYINGGPGAGTMATLVASKVGFFECEFDGVDWGYVASSATAAEKDHDIELSIIRDDNIVLPLKLDDATLNFADTGTGGTLQTAVSIKTQVKAGSSDGATLIAKLKNFVTGTKSVGRTTLNDDEETQVSVVNIAQYRDPVIQLFANDVKKITTALGGDYRVVIRGLDQPIQWIRSGTLDVTIFVPYEYDVVPTSVSSYAPQERRRRGDD